MQFGNPIANVTISGGTLTLAGGSLTSITDPVGQYPASTNLPVGGGHTIGDTTQTFNLTMPTGQRYLLVSISSIANGSLAYQVTVSGATTHFPYYNENVSSFTAPFMVCIPTFPEVESNLVLTIGPIGNPLPLCTYFLAAVALADAPVDGPSNLPFLPAEQPLIVTTSRKPLSYDFPAPSGIPVGSSALIGAGSQYLESIILSNPGSVTTAVVTYGAPFPGGTDVGVFIIPNGTIPIPVGGYPLPANLFVYNNGGGGAGSLFVTAWLSS